MWIAASLSINEVHMLHHLRNKNVPSYGKWLTELASFERLIYRLVYYAYYTPYYSSADFCSLAVFLTYELEF